MEKKTVWIVDDVDNGISVYGDYRDMYKELFYIILSNDADMERNQYSLEDRFNILKMAVKDLQEGVTLWDEVWYGEYEVQ